MVHVMSGVLFPLLNGPQGCDGMELDRYLAETTVVGEPSRGGLMGEIWEARGSLLGTITYPIP